MRNERQEERERQEKQKKGGDSLDKIDGRPLEQFLVNVEIGWILLNIKNLVKMWFTSRIKDPGS